MWVTSLRREALELRNEGFEEEEEEEDSGEGEEDGDDRHPAAGQFRAAAAVAASQNLDEQSVRMMINNAAITDRVIRGDQTTLAGAIQLAIKHQYSLDDVKDASFMASGETEAVVPSILIDGVVDLLLPANDFVAQVSVSLLLLRFPILMEFPLFCE
jgi:hypothetical protein